MKNIFQTLDSLPDEIRSAENTAYQLLSAGEKTTSLNVMLCLFSLCTSLL